MKHFFIAYLLLFLVPALIAPLLIAGNREPVNLYLFYTNDLHGGIAEQEADFLNPQFPPMLGGGASAASIIFNYRQKAKDEGNPFLLLDAGDIFQGTPIGTKTAGKAIVDYMNLVGYDAVTAGNHDFDLGRETFIQITKDAQFPILSANLYDKSRDTVLSHVKPHVIIEKEGIKFGIFGITTEATEQMSFEENIKGLEFKPELPATRRAVKELRQKGADLIIGLVHLGLPYDTEEGYQELLASEEQNQIKRSYLNAMEMAHYVKGIDILMGGHIHRGYHEPWVDPKNHTIVFQNYGNGGNLGMALIKLDPVSKSVIGYELPGEESGLLLLSEDEFWPHPAVYDSIKKVQNRVEKGFDEVIGTTKLALSRGQGEAPMNNLICDAMLQAAQADFAFTNFGGIRSDIKIGPITPRDIFKVLPFGNSIVVLHLKGSLLKDLIETKVQGYRSGMAIGGGQVVIEDSKPDMNKVAQMRVNHKPIDSTEVYRVATTDYLAEGNSGLHQLADLSEKKIDRTGTLLRTAVIEYIKKHSPLAIKSDGRWVRK